MAHWKEVFALKHLSPTGSEDSTAISPLIKFIEEFVDGIEPQQDSQDNRWSNCVDLVDEPLYDDRQQDVLQFSDRDVKDLKRVTTILRGDAKDLPTVGSIWCDQWYPKYGCVLVMERTCVAQTSLRLVYLDAWCSQVHLAGSNVAAAHSAIPNHVGVLECGEIPSHLVAQFNTNLLNAFRDAQKSRNHQKTAHFMDSVIRRAIDVTAIGTAGKNESSYGEMRGSTDSRNHESGTCWPLICAVMLQYLSGNGGNSLLKKTLVNLQLRLTRSQLADLTRHQTSTSFFRDKDNVFGMLAEVSLQVIELADQGYQVARAVEACQRLREQLDELIHSVNKPIASQFTLEASEDMLSAVKTSFRPVMDPPVRIDVTQVKESIAVRRARARTNLKVVELFVCGYYLSSGDGSVLIPHRTPTIRSLFKWLSTQKSDSSESHLLLSQLRGIEQFFFESSRALKSGDSGSAIANLEDLEQVHSTVGEYQKLLTCWRSHADSAQLVTVQQQSRELLVVWIATCLVHRHCVQMIPHVDKYGLPLNWRHLDVMVAREKEVLEALENVAHYVRKWSKPDQIFSIGDPSATFQLAYAYASSSDTIKQRAMKETNQLEEKVLDTWKVVEEKKDDAEECKREIDELKTQLIDVQARLDAEKHKNDLSQDEFDENWRRHSKKYRYRHNVDRTHEDWLRSKVRATERQIASSTTRLRHIQRMPQFLVNPLPNHETECWKVLFSLMMPEELNCCGDLLMKSQQLLVPPRCRSDLKGGSFSTSWHDHYSAYSKNSVLVKHVVFFPISFEFPNWFGPSTIDEVFGLDDYRQKCVWHPSGFAMGISWRSGANTNPFLVDHRQSIDYFTCQLSQQVHQWAANHPDGKDKGNEVYARLHQRPQDFPKSSYLAFGLIRSAANLQSRKLINALQEDILLWHQPMVKDLIRQSVYQVGELTDESVPRHGWKTDLWMGQEVMEEVCEAFHTLAKVLSQTPRRHEDLHLLGELSGYFYQLCPSAKNAVDSFVHTAMEWASDARRDMGNPRLNTKEATSLRARECLMNAYALCAYSLGPLDDRASEHMCELVVRFQNGLIFAGEDKAWNTLLHFNVLVTETMTRRIGALSEYVSSRKDRNGLLTRLLRAIQPRAPQNLTWAKLALGYCYEAIAGGVHYAVNIFNGVVLVDGHPPCRLPSQVTSHPRYRALFGQKNFEVSLSSGIFQTVQAFDGCFFDFAVLDGELFVQEVYEDKRNRVQLCPSSYTDEGLRDDLPVRWRKMFSHWFWIEGNAVLFRSKTSAFDKRISVCLVFDRNDDGEVVGLCCKIPLGDQTAGFQKIAQKAKAGAYEYLMVLNASLVDVVAKFEKNEFIHTLWTPHETIKIDLPRFEQSFEINARGEVVSCQQPDFRLCRVQQMDDFFPNFTNYLLLERMDSENSISHVQRLMVVPVGDVVRVDESFTIDINEHCAHQHKLALLEEHSRLHVWTAKTIASRLQLASIYAAAGSVVPEKRLCMTGTEAALETVRRCWKNTPLSAEEAARLRNLIELSDREPSLRILAFAMSWRPEQLGFLQESVNAQRRYPISQAKTAYVEMCNQSHLNSLRKRLRLDEEKRICGHVHHAQVAKPPSTHLVELKSVPVPLDWVEQAEATLKQLFQVKEGRSSIGAVPSFPLTSFTESRMGKDMYDELATSWQKHHQQPRCSIGVDVKSPRISTQLEKLMTSVYECLAKVEMYLRASIEKEKLTVQHRLLRCANCLPQVTVMDLIRIAFDDSILPKLRPDLDATARQHYRDATLLFLELGVFEDKLHRVRRLVAGEGTKENVKSALLDELKSAREWKSGDHPRWLAFEAEARLQIRHEQYVIAMHLIANPQAICQLNMGRGKTRVILPMLFLFFTDPGRRRSQANQKTIVRAHFLPPLLSETIQFMHQNLSSSSLGVQFYQQPFDRTKELSSTNLMLMKEQLDEVCATGGVLITSPSFILSLELKRLEFLKSKRDEERQLADGCLALMESFKYVDILDESDALLHHKYHLVYAIGAPQSLPDGKVRWLMAEYVLQLLNGWRKFTSAVGRVLSKPNLVVIDGVCARKNGGFCGVRVTESVGKALSVAFAEDLLDSSLLDLKWMRHYVKKHGRGSEQWFVDAITDASVDVQVLRSKNSWLSDTSWDQLLALRGLLAFGLLEHCLQKRCRERYGIPPLGSRKKRIAVPFLAADLPSERSEFTHPDVAIVLTLLGYYHIGLTKDQMHETLQSLLRLDESKQRFHYDAWYSSVEAQLCADDKTKLRSVLCIDLTNAIQMELLYNTFRFAIPTINFFLNYCVFPFDVTQYPQQIQRTAWHLVPPSRQAVGFSGTNDNHRLLPLSVRQKEPQWDELLGTNGKMVDCILRQCIKYEVLRPSCQPSTKPNWQHLLEFAWQEKTHAIIDAGALLAGVTNLDAAKFLVDLPGFEFAGVTFYDPLRSVDRWMVLEKRRRQCFALHESHDLLEKDTFVIFDEARSRGADMKLLADAVATVTLGPNMTKDKLMQGCGRMRQLHNQQRLVFVSFPEVEHRILKTMGSRTSGSLLGRSSHPNIVDVMQWVLETTNQEATHGLSEWASNGLHFAETNGTGVDAEYLDDDWSLSTLYGGSQASEWIAEYISRKAGCSQCPGNNPDAALLVDKICGRGKKYGYDNEILVSTNDTECERELCVEEEEELEREQQQATYPVKGEIVWKYEAMTAVSTASDVNQWIGVQSLHDFLGQRILPSEIATLNWHQARIYGTVNFYRTVAQLTKRTRSEFLRVVDCMLVFDDASILLLSDFEANAILKLLWRCNDSVKELPATRMGQFCFVHLTQMRRAVASGAPPKMVLSTGSMANNKHTFGPEFWLQPTLQFATVCLQVFNGETCLDHDHQKPLLRQLLASSSQGRAKLVELIRARGNGYKWMLSTVDLVCRDLNVEESVQCSGSSRPASAAA